MKRTDLKKSLKTIKQQIGSSQPQSTLYDPLQTYNITKSFCECTDASGHPKMLYKTKKEAIDAIADKSQKLNTYPCPFEKGWHLTKG